LRPVLRKTLRRFAPSTSLLAGNALWQNKRMPFGKN
jgi:hypothetical protein